MWKCFDGCHIEEYIDSVLAFGILDYMCATVHMVDCERTILNKSVLHACLNWHPILILTKRHNDFID